MTYRIGQFNDSFPPVMDGVALTVRNYAYWLNQKMGETTVVTLKVPGYVDREPFPIVRYPSIPLFFKPPYRIGLPALDPLLSSRLSTKGFNLVHAHTPFSTGHIAYKLAKKNHIPIVATFHSKYRDDLMRFIPSARLVDCFIRKIVRFLDSVDEVWLPQESVAETVREYGYRGKYVVMENGTDFVCAQDLLSFKAESKARLGLNPDQKMFLFVGQLTEEKNTSFIVKALHFLKDLDFHHYFVGVGYAKSDLEQLSRELGMEDRVHFLGAVYDRKKLHSIYSAADLFLFPSLYDNAPLVLREAAAAGTPAVLLENSTAGVVLQDGVNGFLSATDVEAYANKVRFAVSDPERLYEIGIEASKTICRSWESIVEEVQNRYLYLIKHHK